MPATSIEELQEELFRWVSPAFFQFDERVASLIEQNFFRKEFFGLLITAPLTVSLSEKNSLPMVLLERRDAVRLWDVAFDLNTILIAVNLSQGDLRYGLAASKPDSGVRRWEPGSVGSRLGPKPEGKQAGITITKAHILDAREICKLPWEPERYALSVISYDWVSNTRLVELEGKHGPIERVSLAEAAKVNRVPQVGLQDELPVFLRTAKNPALPSQGVALSISNAFSATAERLPVYGSFRIALPEYAIIGVTSGSDSERQALVRGTLLLIQKDVPVSARVNLVIPILGRGPKQSGDLVEGFFGIDLKQEIRDTLVPGQYVLYFLLDRHISAPLRLDVGK
jgi:hypothetical protein